MVFTFPSFSWFTGTVTQYAMYNALINHKSVILLYLLPFGEQMFPIGPDRLKKWVMSL